MEAVKEDGTKVVVGDDCLRGFNILMQREHTLERLRRIGITHSTLFPEPEGLAKELERLY